MEKLVCSVEGTSSCTSLCPTSDPQSTGCPSSVGPDSMASASVLKRTVLTKPGRENSGVDSSATCSSSDLVSFPDPPEKKSFSLLFGEGLGTRLDLTLAGR